MFGGVDGLDFYRIIFKHFDEIIVNKGFMGFEFGYVKDDNIVNLRIFLDGENDELLWRDKE